MNKSEQQAAIGKISQEMRRGVVILATLSQLKEERYGYALIDQLAQQGLDIDQGTLYPLLRRLESQGLLDSRWILSGARPRRYYQINSSGEAVLRGLLQEWHEMIGVMANLLDGTNERRL